MHSTLNFSTIKHSKLNKNQLSLKRLSNQSSKSHFIGNQNHQNKEGKATIQSTKHRSKGKEEAFQSNRIIEDNSIKPSGLGRNFKEAEMRNKILERAISNLFKYIKSVLPKEAYSSIKTMFIVEMNKLNTTLSQDDSVSSIVDMIKTPLAKCNSGLNHSRHLNKEEIPAKSLKLSYDFFPIAKETNNNPNANRNYNSNYIHMKNKHSEIYKSQPSLKGISNNNNHNYSHYHHPISNKHYNLFNDKKHSLYSLTKNGAVINKTRSNSKSQSNSREHSSIMNKRSGLSSNVSFAKFSIATNNSNTNHTNTHKCQKSIQTNVNITSTHNKKQSGRVNTTVNINNYKNAIKKSIITKTQNLLNTKLFSKLQNDLIKMENSKNCSIDYKSNYNHNPNSNKQAHSDNNSIKNCPNDKSTKKDIVKNYSLEKITKENVAKIAIDKKKLQSHRNEKETIKDTEKKANKNQSTNIGMKMNSNDQTKTFETKGEYMTNNNDNNIICNNHKGDNSDNVNDTNDIKNSEQLKKIKSSLDENLKVMFNFSYECFLNRESESESKSKSKRSNEDNNTQLGDKNKKLTYSYKKKYNY